MANTGLRHLSLRARDLKKTERFYTEVLGLRVPFRVPPKMIFFRSPNGGDLLGFVKRSRKPSGVQALDHFGFKVTKSSLKRTERLLRIHGIEIDGRRGKNAIYLSDPNGYCVELYSD